MGEKDRPEDIIRTEHIEHAEEEEQLAVSSGAPEPVDDSAGGEQLDAFVDGELTAEQARRDRIDARGAGLITTSAALATLMFAASGLITATEKYAPPRGTIWFLGVTLLAFTWSAVCGLLAARSGKVEVVTTAQLLAWRNDDDNIWRNTQDNVRWLLTRAKIVHVDSLHLANNRRAVWAVLGGVGQLFALAGLLLSVGLIFAHAIWPDVRGVFDMMAPA